MYWPIIMIILAAALVIGPIMMFQPSSRDKRLASLRQQAAQKGISVRLTSLTRDNNKQTLAVYSLAFDQTDEARSEWQLVKQSFQHGLHFDQEWDWLDGNNAAPESEWDTIRSQLQQLDNDMPGLEQTKHSIGIWWTENANNIDTVEGLLRQFVRK